MRISDWSSDVCSSDLGDNPAEERQLDHKAITIKELCALYVADLDAGLILGKGGRPKKSTTTVTDSGRTERNIIDRKRDVQGKSVSFSVDIGGRRLINQ